jgi:hypothetical protein
MPRRNRSTVIQGLRIFFWSALLLSAAGAWLVMIRMPGTSFTGTPPPLSPDEQRLRSELVSHVQKFAGEIGERNLSYYPALQQSADYIESQLMGWKIRRDSYELDGKTCANIEAERPGKSPEIVLIGAHYDSVFGSPGANDNGSGVAALLALAHRFVTQPNHKTLRFVAFVNEEPGHFQTESMGSHVYAARCRQRGEQIVAMISLETIGYFSSKPGSQKYPVTGLGLIYPRTGNFIGFVSNLTSRSLLRDVMSEFRRHATIPSEGAAMPEIVPGVSWSDQWSFWQHNYSGIMVTDTAPFRYPYYHSPADTSDKLDYDSMTRVVAGMEHVIRHLVNQ